MASVCVPTLNVKGGGATKRTTSGYSMLAKKVHPFSTTSPMGALEDGDGVKPAFWIMKALTEVSKKDKYCGCCGE